MGEIETTPAEFGRCRVFDYLADWLLAAVWEG